jgi:DNA-binding NtrC family response regulator
MGTYLKQFSPEAIKMLQERKWPGNIRELRNVVERLIILGSQTISKEDVEMFA